QEDVKAKVDKAIEEGAELLFGGNVVEGKGNFFEPTILGNVTNDMEIMQEEVYCLECCYRGNGTKYFCLHDFNVTNDMEIMQEEVFGPVAPVATFKTIDEAIELANDSEYGLTSSVYTENINKAMKIVAKLKFGETYINRENFEAMQ